MKETRLSQPRRPRQFSTTHSRDTARLGLEAALTAAVALAQLLDDADICDRLVTIKRDVLRRHRSIDQPPAATLLDQSPLFTVN